jgi:hypothetical protein
MNLKNGAPMNRDRCLVLKIATAFILLASIASSAEECFNSSKKLNDDAQTIRLKAMDMGWTVGKSASITPASIVRWLPRREAQGYGLHTLIIQAYTISSN